MQHPLKKKYVKSNTRAIVCIGLMIIGVAAAVLLISNGTQSPSSNTGLNDTQPESGVRTLQTISRNEISSITVTNNRGSYTVLVSEENCMMETPDGLVRIDSVYADELVSAVADITVQGTVFDIASDADAKVLADMGLEPPSTRAVVRKNDGKEYTIETGGNVPETTYAYYRCSLLDGIYMCDIGISDILRMSSEVLLPVEQPAIGTNLITGMRIIKHNETIELRFRRTESGDYAELISPLCYPVDDDKAAQLLNAVNSFYLGTSAPQITSANASDYGFDDPLLICECARGEGYLASISDEGTIYASLSEPSTFVFILGAEIEPYIYSCCYDGSYYLVSGLQLKPLLEADQSSLVTRHPMFVGSRQLSQIQITSGSMNWQLTLDYTADDDGKAITNAFVNGKAIPNETYDLLINWLDGFSVSADVPFDWSAEGKEIRWQMCITETDGTQRSLVFYAADTFFDAVSLNGGVLHLCSNETLQQLVNMLPAA